jgi:hypothetical protein
MTIVYLDSFLCSFIALSHGAVSTPELKKLSQDSQSLVAFRLECLLYSPQFTS